MRTIKLSEVTVLPNRQRTIFEPEALQELKNSIEQGGLLHPLVLRPITELDLARYPDTPLLLGSMALVAGERRLRAITELLELGGSFVCDGQHFDEARGEVPYTTLGELDELQAEEAELEENFRRRDLTWQEQAAATERLHQLRGRQKVQAAVKAAEAQGIPAEIAPVVKQTVAETAKELTGRSDGSYQDDIRKRLIVAKHLDDPVVAKAKSVDDAYKLLKKRETATKNIELAAQVGASFNAKTHRLLNMSCLDYMKTPEAKGQFDVILTDPPYGMDAQDFSDGGGRLAGIEHHYDDSYESWQVLMKEFTKLSFEITKPEAHAYVFCDFDRFHELKSMMEEAGWYVFRTPFIIHKINSGRVPLPDRGPRRQYEILLYAIKGKKMVTNIYADVISAQADQNMTHGAQKPVAVYQNLLQRSVKPGDKVFDGFAGSGTIFPAAHLYKVTAVATELNPEYYGMCLRRLEQLDTQDDLFN